jgi:hypothetical protein
LLGVYRAREGGEVTSELPSPPASSGWRQSDPSQLCSASILLFQFPHPIPGRALVGKNLEEFRRADGGASCKPSRPSFQGMPENMRGACVSRVCVGWGTDGQSYFSQRPCSPEHSDCVLGTSSEHLDSAGGWSKATAVWAPSQGLCFPIL